jgi:hypothetical protein
VSWSSEQNDESTSPSGRAPPTPASTGTRHRARSQEPAPTIALSERDLRRPRSGSHSVDTARLRWASPHRLDDGLETAPPPTQELRHHRGEALTESEACALAPPRKCGARGSQHGSRTRRVRHERGGSGRPLARCHRPRHTGYSMALATLQNPRSQR